jgi:DNA modification methylase
MVVGKEFFMPQSWNTNDQFVSGQDLTIEWWDIDRPKDYSTNPRKWSTQAIEKVASSIREFGWRQPVVVDKDEIIAIGHLRRTAGKSIGLTQCPVHVARDLTPAQIRGLRLADNRTNQEAEWDLSLLGPELLDLKTMDFDLSLSGFDSREIDDLLRAAGNDKDDAVPEVPQTPVSRLGDKWILGQHRVFCGDATDASTLQNLLAGNAADLVFTDPPYNVDYEGYTDKKLKIENDRMEPEEFNRFLRAAFINCREAVKQGSALYICHASSVQREFQNALEAAGFEVRCQIIWAKNTFAWGFGRYKFQHEPIFYCHVAGQSDAWYGDKSQSTLWQEKKPAANRLHPTMKPVELIERALVNSSKSGDIIADLFGGSGSTLIACEKMGRSARLMELDPRYVDVIVHRWQEYTDKQATLYGDGRTFDEVAQERREAPV